jgi:hypothetical protein
MPDGLFLDGDERKVEKEIMRILGMTLKTR